MPTQFSLHTARGSCGEPLDPPDDEPEGQDDRIADECAQADEPREYYDRFHAWTCRVGIRGAECWQITEDTVIVSLTLLGIRTGLHAVAIDRGSAGPCTECPEGDPLACQAIEAARMYADQVLAPAGWEEADEASLLALALLKPEYGSDPDPVRARYYAMAALGELAGMAKIWLPAATAIGRCRVVLDATKDIT